MTRAASPGHGAHSVLHGLLGNGGRVPSVATPRATNGSLPVNGRGGRFRVGHTRSNRKTAVGNVGAPGACLASADWTGELRVETSCDDGVGGWRVTTASVFGVTSGGTIKTNAAAPANRARGPASRRSPPTTERGPALTFDHGRSDCSAARYLHTGSDGRACADQGRRVHWRR